MPTQERSPEAKLKSAILTGIAKSDTPMQYARDAIRSHGLPFPGKVVLIADGNGRWAKQQEPPVSIPEGHIKGAEAIITLLRDCYPLAGDIQSIAVWVVSPDNIAKRDPQEIQALMNLTQMQLQALYPELQQANARFIHLGSKEGLPDVLADALTYTEEATKENTGVKVALAINFNGDQEDFDAVNRVQDYMTETGRRVTRQEWLALRDPKELGQANLIVRPGGDRRLSNMGLIAASGELVFSPVLMPDFTAKDFARTFVEYAFRQRRGGGRTTLG